MVNGMLNHADMSSATTFVQDAFNQYCVLPDYTVHLKIIELALASDLEYEAKRHACFIQQLWDWEPNEFHDAEFVALMRETQQLPDLSKEAIQKLFEYFGFELTDDDLL